MLASGVPDAGGATPASAVALRAAPLTARRSGGRVVGWIRRGERAAVVQRADNRVRCRLCSGKLGWASVAVERTGTPLLRLREDGKTHAASLAVLGQRSQDALTFGGAPVIRRVAMSPYQPHPSPSAKSSPAIDEVLSVVKVTTQSSSPKVPVRRPATPDRQLLVGCRMAEAGNLPFLREVITQLGEDVVQHSTSDGGRTLLHFAARGGQLEIVQYLLTLGAPLNAADIDGKTPLMNAASCLGPLAHLCAATLLSAGADHDQLDARQYDAAHHASLHGNSGVLRILLSTGASVSGRCVPLGRTPLHLAAENNHPVCVQLLVDASADANARTADGMTPVHCAAWRGALGPMHLLLRSGADASVRTQEGHTALDLAVGFENQQCAQLLQYHSVIGMSEGTSAPPDHCDLEMFSTPQQLLEERLIVPLSDRVVAALGAVADCLGASGAPKSLTMDPRGEATDAVQNRSRLRPLSAKSKAVAALLTFDEYEESKRQRQQQGSDDVATSDEENQNPADAVLMGSMITTTSSKGHLSTSSSHDDMRGMARRQRSAPAFRSTSGSRVQTDTSRPQTAAAAVHRVIPRPTSLARRKHTANAGPDRSGVAMPHAGPLILSVQGTVRSATLGWGAREWEQAGSQFKLASTPEVWDVKVGLARNAINTDKTRRDPSNIKAGLATLTQQPTSKQYTRGRPKSAVPTRSSDGSLQFGVVSSVSLVDCRVRPGSAIPTTTQWQPPGVEEAAAHYLTAAQKLKRQEERLALNVGSHSSVGSLHSDSTSRAAVDIDLSLYHPETPAARAERKATQMQAATSIQAIARGHLVRRRPG